MVDCRSPDKDGGDWWVSAGICGDLPGSVGICGDLWGSAGSCPCPLCRHDNDELDRYLMRDTEDELSDRPLSYWQEHSNDIRSNNVAKMASEVFSIPAIDRKSVV